MRFGYCIEHHLNFCRSCIFSDQWLTWHREQTVICRTIGSVLNDSSFFLDGYNLPILFFRCLFCPNRLPTRCGLSPLWISLVSSNLRPGIQGTLTSYLPSAFVEMFSTTSVRTSSCKLSPNLLLLTRPNCTTDRNQSFCWSSGICVMVTTENDPNKGRPINYDSTVGTTS